MPVHCWTLVSVKISFNSKGDPCHVFDNSFNRDCKLIYDENDNDGSNPHHSLHCFAISDMLGRTTICRQARNVIYPSRVMLR